MLIPIGQENSTVRRHPLVTYGLIAANFLVFAFTWTFASSAPWARSSEKLREVGQYVFEHPYLEMPQELAPFCDQGCREALTARRDAYIESEGVPDASALGESQRAMDGLVRQLYEARRQIALYRYGFVPARAEAETWITSLFLHAGWMHILGNMLFLLVSAPFIEDRFGRPLFIALYLLSGIAGCAAYLSVHSGNTVPLVGASGAVAGVMGAFLVRLSRARIRFLYLPFFPLPRPRFQFLIPAFVVLPAWALQQLWHAQQESSAGGVAFSAHVGGFAFGVLAALALKMSRAEERLIDPAIEKEITLTQHPRLEKALEARVRGDLVVAERHVKAVLAAEPQNVDAWRESYDIAVAAGNAADASVAAARVIEMHAAARDIEGTRAFVAEALGGESGLAPRVYLAAATALERLGDPIAALTTYDELLQRDRTDASAFRALFRRGQILTTLGETAAARKELEAARAHPACVEAMRGAVEAAIERLGASATRPAH